MRVTRGPPAAGEMLDEKRPGVDDYPWRIEYRPAANIHGLAAALRFVIHEPRRNRFVTSVLSLHLESQARKPTQPDGQHGDH